MPNIPFDEDDFDSPENFEDEGWRDENGDFMDDYDPVWDEFDEMYFGSDDDEFFD